MMAEYIDRRRLFNALADYRNIPHDWDGGIAQPCEDALAFIENAPEEDVVPVVRCKDCKHYHDFETHFDCNLLCGMDDVQPNDFCSYGERKDGDTDG